MLIPSVRLARARWAARHTRLGCVVWRPRQK